jgi:photosystem II stability/assembly factor-like uncharacterized protein
MKSIFIVLTLFALNTAISQSDYWKQTAGPYTGNVSQIQIQPSGRIFAITDYYRQGSAGLYHSDDHGNTWSRNNIPNAQYGQFNFADVVGLSPDGYIYIYADDGTTYKSTNNGNDWIPANRISHTSVPEILFCISNAEAFAVANGVLLRSTDGGTSWLEIAFAHNYINVLAKDSTGIMYASDASVVAGRIQSSVYRSIDSGQIWSSILTIYFNGVQALAVNGDGRLFAGTSDGRILSSEGVDTLWSEIKVSNKPINTVVLDLSQNLYAGTGGAGVFKSSDDGNSWSNIGLSDKSVQSLASNNDYLYAGLNNDGGFYTFNSGGGWLQRGMSVTSVWALTTDSKGNAFAGVLGRDSDGGVYKSIDTGAHWFQINSGLTNLDVVSLCTDKLGNLYAGTEWGGTFRLVNGSASWMQSGPTLDVIWSMAANSKGFIFAGGDDSGRVYRSSDAGITWALVHINPSSGQVFELTSHPNDNLYAGIVNEGVLISTDNGETWKHTSVPDSTVESVCVNSSGQIFAGTLSSGIFRSTDNGSTWTQANNGLTNNWVWQLACNSLDQLFAGTIGGGVFKSTNEGNDWIPINSGLTIDLEVRALAFDANEYLYSAFGSGGVSRSVVPTVTGVPKERIVLKTFSMQQNYPNPFNPKTTISFSLPSRGHVSVKIFDLLGKEISTLLDDIRDPGDHSVDWDASSFASGVYFYRMQAGNFVQTKKMVLLK